MDWVQVVLLSIVQGITEFLPISSSAHLILVPLVMELPDQGVVFDIALHMGTLLAVIFYFRTDFFSLLRGLLSLLQFNFKKDEARLVLNLALSTLPLILLALVIADFVADGARNLSVLAITSICFGLLLYLSDWAAREKVFSYLNVIGIVADVWPTWLFPNYYRKTAQAILMGARKEVREAPKEDINQIGWGQALVFGLFQALALIPGTSRSGICMTAGRFLNFSREASSHYAMLMAMPTIFLAGVYSVMGHFKDQSATHFSMSHFALGFVLSFTMAYLSIHFLMKFVERIGFLPFVIYRVVLGFVLFSVVLYT